jgi:signal transduction histidine kinase
VQQTMMDQIAIHEPRSILLIEDDDDHAQITERVLSRGNCRFVVERAASLSEAITKTTSRSFDAILCDLTLADSEAVNTISTIRKQSPETPILILTSLASEQMACIALQQGAQDYLLKSGLTGAGSGAKDLERAIRHAIQRQAAEVSLRRRERRLQKKNLRLSQLYNVAQTVVENVSHEFRTPLTVIKEYVALLEEGMLGELTPEQKHFLDVIGDRADDLNRMVDDMLDVSKFDAGILTVRRGHCNIVDVIHHVMLPLSRKAALKDVELTVDIEDNLPRVYCDPDKAGRTIVNLAVNAIKVCPKYGMVKLAARFDRQAQEVVIEVVDNGSGILRRDLQRIFTRFAQVDADPIEPSKNIGLGLSIVRELVDMNLGQVNVTSEVGEGSCFSFTLPVANPSEIARRFLSRLRTRGGAPQALLCSVRADTQQSTTLDEIESLLTYVLRTSDLVFRGRPSQWIVLLNSDEAGYESFRKRVRKTVRQTNRNRVESTLPALATKLIGKWDLKQDAETMITTLQECLSHHEISLT